MTGNKTFNVGIYIRLSKEDENKQATKDSESIINQRRLIYDYLKNGSYKTIKEYVDDGYSGTTFNRPGFEALLKDIELGIINMVITKDLSRLGRDYIKSGYYLEEYFPSKKVRYVAILDGIDTFTDNESVDIAPFKALFNDMVAKDTSKKIKSILKNKKEQGLFLGSKAPFGYLKDPHNKHHLIINYKTALIVKKIYELAVNNYKIKEIVTILNNEKIVSPRGYIYKKDYPWTYTAVYNILHNREYTGCLVQNVWTTISYKNRKRVKKNQDLWVITPNAHQPIIDIETFNKVNGLKNKRTKLLLEDLIYCKECDTLMYHRYVKKRCHHVFICRNYHYYKTCTSHYINYTHLEKMISKIIGIDINENNIHNLIKRIYVNQKKEIEIL